MLEPVEITDFFADSASEPAQEVSLHVFGSRKDSKLFHRPLRDGDERHPCNGMPRGGSQYESLGLLCSLPRLDRGKPMRSSGVSRLEGGREPAIAEDVGREPGLNGATQSRLTWAGAVPRHGSQSLETSSRDDCCDTGARAMFLVAIFEGTGFG